MPTLLARIFGRFRLFFRMYFQVKEATICWEGGKFELSIFNRIQNIQLVYRCQN